MTWADQLRELEGPCDPFGEQLRAARQRRHRTAWWVAERCRELAPRVPGISPAAISQWENEVDRRTPSVAQFWLVARALEVSRSEVEDLLDAAIHQYNRRGAR